MSVSSPSQVYSRVSIIAHWLAAVAVVALFLTHEADRGSSGWFFHVSIGAVLGVFLLWRVLRRIRNGFAEESNQSVVLRLLSKSVHWGLLLAIVTVVITGYLLPWTRGAGLDVGGLFEIPSPMSGNRDLHELVEGIHDIAGHLFMPLLLLHILGAIKHAVIDRDGVLKRMITPNPDGK